MHREWRRAEEVRNSCRNPGPGRWKQQMFSYWICYELAPFASELRMGHPAGMKAVSSRTTGGETTFSGEAETGNAPGNSPYGCGDQRLAVRWRWLFPALTKTRGTDSLLRLDVTLTDKLADRMPRWLWPKVRFVFYVLAFVEILALLVALFGVIPADIAP
jgi:hypothetical protein